jgi:lysophospholipase L1-like esterase
MADEDPIQQAIATGRRQAAAVLSMRDNALVRRRRALEEARPTIERPANADRLISAAGGRESAGCLVAEGDSWFSCGGMDVLRKLEDEHGYDVHDVARAGDRIEEMAYHSGQLAAFVALLERVVRKGEVPKAILLSGGGNDIAGKHFEMLLDHASSPYAGLNDHVLHGVVRQRIPAAFATILSAIGDVCDTRVSRRVPILIHGYDYPVADGRGYKGGWPLPGPWLEPGFRRKGYMRMPFRLETMRTIIDEFNAALQQLPATSGLQHVRYVDLRGSLSAASDYQDWWEDELHPTDKGFSRIAERFAKAIARP